MRCSGFSAVALGALLIAGPTQAAGVKIGECIVSLEKVERADQWQDPVGGIYSPKVRAADGQEVLLVTLAIDGAGSVTLEGFKAKGSDGQEHPGAQKSIESSRFDADGKPSTARHTFQRTLAFVVPKGAAIDYILVQGVSVPLPKKGTATKP